MPGNPAGPVTVGVTTPAEITGWAGVGAGCAGVDIAVGGGAAAVGEAAGAWAGAAAWPPAAGLDAGTAAPGFAGGGTSEETKGMASNWPILTARTVQPPTEYSKKAAMRMARTTSRGNAPLSPNGHIL